jgi:hypothetical protein
MLKYLWCLIFHRKHHHRTGERRIHRVSIAYDTRCDKCGMEDTEMVWFL